MPNIASVFKEEIARIARKEVKRETTGLKKAANTYRSEIAALKRRADGLERLLKRTQRSLARTSGESRRAEAAADDDGPSLRFRPKGLAALRKRLGISASDCGQLLGVTGQSIYLWESGRARPSAERLAAIAELRRQGKRAVTARLEQLQEG
jgi:DNA-binding transcriptional regulator YiaG